MDSAVLEVLGVTITPWKLVGYLGVALFAGRWLVQLLASRRHGRPMVTPLFWYMSISGSVLLLAYFIWGKNDSVGILANAFPLTVALYNLHLSAKARRPRTPAGMHPGRPMYGYEILREGMRRSARRLRTDECPGGAQPEDRAERA